MINKRGSTLRAIFAVVGAIFFLIAIYFLNVNEILQAAIFGIIGILLIAITSLPLIKSSSK